MHLSPNEELSDSVGSLQFTGLSGFKVPLRHVLLSSSSFVVVGSETDCDSALCVPNLRPAINTQCKKIFFSLGCGDSLSFGKSRTTWLPLCAFLFNAHANSEDLTLKNPEMSDRKEETTSCF